jgi:hypothetical protein
VVKAMERGPGFMEGVKVGGIKAGKLSVAKRKKVRFNKAMSRRKRDESIHKEGRKRKRRGWKEKRI